MNLSKLFIRNEQIEQCLRSLGDRNETLLRSLGRPYQELIAAQERLLNAAEQLADCAKRMG